MNTRTWRSVIGLVLGAAVVAPWSTLGAALLLGGAAYVVLQAGYRAWPGGPQRRSTTETYWRGRRIERHPRGNGTGTMPVRPPLHTILSLALGTGLAGIALSLLLAVVSRG